MPVEHMSNPAHIIVVTGPSGSGKTALCQRLVRSALRRGVSVRGILSPARWAGGVKVGIDARDLSTGEQRRLAEASDEAGGPTTFKWRFHSDTLAWGMDVLRRSAPGDLLVIDELGPLELVRGEGWAGALDILRAGDYRQAVVVVRPELVQRFLALAPAVQATVVDVTQVGEGALLRRLARLWQDSPHATSSPLPTP